MDAADLIKRLKLRPHPEGGWYRETWRSAAAMPDGRAAATSILFLLEQGQRSHWHRVDAEELWIFQAGTPLKLQTNEGGDTSRRGWVLGRASRPSIWSAPTPGRRPRPIAVGAW